MMAGIPKVKIQFDADLDGLKKGSKDAEDQVGGFAGKVEDFGKKAAAAFAVAAAAAVAYAGKLAIEGVKAAIEDEQAQLKLARALETATGATDAQIKAVEEQILKTSLATGVADDKLRPALQRLAVATGDTEKAQKLLNLALDISQATGKPLEAVSNALGRAYEGNTSALAKLQVGISTADAKTLGYTGAVQRLTDLYGGAAAANADTYQGRIDRIGVAFNEVKETIGVALLPILDTLLTFVTDEIIPLFETFSEKLNGDNGLVTNFMAVVDYITEFFEPIVNAIKNAFIEVGRTLQEKKEDFKDILNTMKDVWAWVDKYLIPLFKVTLVKAIEDAVDRIKIAINLLLPVVKFILNNIKDSINGFIDLINVAIRAYNLFARLTFREQVPLIDRIGEISTNATNLGNRPFGVGMTGATSTTGTAGTAGTTGTTGTAGGKTGTGDPSLDKIAETDWNKLLLDATGALADAIKTQSDSLKTLEALSPDAANRARLGLPPLLGDIPSNFDVARVRQGEEAGNTINITVNGALDSESTARQIQQILNDSQARGTLGAGGFRTAAVA
jgi:hypothetical protein